MRDSLFRLVPVTATNFAIRLKKFASGWPNMLPLVERSASCRRDVMTIQTYHAASRQPAMARYCKCCSRATVSKLHKERQIAEIRQPGMPALRNPSRKRSRSATRAKGRSRRGSLAVRAGIRRSN